MLLDEWLVFLDVRGLCLCPVRWALGMPAMRRCLLVTLRP